MILQSGVQERYYTTVMREFLGRAFRSGHRPYKTGISTYYYTVSLYEVYYSGTHRLNQSRANDNALHTCVRLRDNTAPQTLCTCDVKIFMHIYNVHNACTL